MLLTILVSGCTTIRSVCNTKSFSNSRVYLQSNTYSNRDHIFYRLNSKMGFKLRKKRKNIKIEKFVKETKKIYIRYSSHLVI